MTRILAIEIRVHHAFACLPHYTGKRGKEERGENFVLNFNGKIKLLQKGYPFKLMNSWDSICKECLGRNSFCQEKKMKEMDMLALFLVNKLMIEKEKNPFLVGKFYGFDKSLLSILRGGFREGNLRKICHSIKCKWLENCEKTARNNFVDALFL